METEKRKTFGTPAGVQYRHGTPTIGHLKSKLQALIHDYCPFIIQTKPPCTGNGLHHNPHGFHCSWTGKVLLSLRTCFWWGGSGPFQTGVLL